MSETTEFEEIHVIQVQKRTFFQKLGAGSLSISILFHLGLVVLGIFWVLQVMPPVEKDVEFMPNSGGGGSPSTDAQNKKHQVRIMQPDMARLAAVGATSSLVLPEPDMSSQMTSLGSISQGGLSAGLGGSGTGGGNGSGDGTGVGSGMAPGLSVGAGTKTPFGILSPDKNALVGTFYDLKQTSDRKPTGMTPDTMRAELKEIVRRGFNEASLAKYFKAPRKLYQTKFYIPRMEASAAPAAFEVQKEVQPSMWVVVYRGSVVAPKSGRFRFVGEADDVMVVRFNNRAVFDYGYGIAGAGLDVVGRFADFDGTNDNPEVAKEMRRSTPMRVPITFYKYQSTPSHNSAIGGLAVGPEFEVVEGRTYPVDILIGEVPGAAFSLDLLIEEIGATYEKDPMGSPILPLFRIDNGLPTPGADAPPFDPNGPVWKFAPGFRKLDI